EYRNDAYTLDGLRLQRSRPHRRTAENCNELAPPHCGFQGWLSTRFTSTWGWGPVNLVSITASAECPLWVKHVQCNGACPLHPRKRTFAVQTGMSAMGQQRTCAVQKSMPLWVKSTSSYLLCGIICAVV